MPIKIPNSLPARETLESENIFVMTEYRAMHQDIRPLKLLILNLMPTKIATETQLLRKFSNTPLQIQVELLRTELRMPARECFQRCLGQRAIRIRTAEAPRPGSVGSSCLRQWRRARRSAKWSLLTGSR